VRERPQLTRVQFAIHYGVKIETPGNRDSGKREPDTTVRIHAPELQEQAFAPATARRIQP
jgi:putative transcriptional regulator